MNSRVGISKLTVTYGVRAAVVGFIAVFSVFVSGALETHDDGLVRAQNPQPVGSIMRISASTPNVVLAVGDSVVLSIDVYGVQNIQDQSLGGPVEFDWSASGGRLPDNADGTSVTYTAPSVAGSYTVTVSPETECVGKASECTATFRIDVRRQGEATGPYAPPRNPEGDIPTVLSDSEGNQYAVFTPEDGGRFEGGSFWLDGAEGIVPNGEVVGIRMADTGPATNAGMSHHRYTLYGQRYAISAVDATGDSVSSYSLDAPIEVCIPVPAELRSSITDVGIVGINESDALTALTSWVRVSPSLSVCANLSVLPATIGAEIPGTPPPAPTATPEPTPELPITGGAAPNSSPLGWVLLIGVAMVASAAVAISRRRPKGAKE